MFSIQKQGQNLLNAAFFVWYFCVRTCVSHLWGGPGALCTGCGGGVTLLTQHSTLGFLKWKPSILTLLSPGCVKDPLEIVNTLDCWQELEKGLWEGNFKTVLNTNWRTVDNPKIVMPQKLNNCRTRKTVSVGANLTNRFASIFFFLNCKKKFRIQATLGPLVHVWFRSTDTIPCV